MMLMAMKPQKSQLSSLYKYTASGSFTKRDLALMFGYTQYEALAVGAAGGRSGGMIYAGAIFYHDPCGGGGGSSKIVSGSISTLPSSVSVVVGAKGSTGSDGSNATDGGRGGNSSFGALVTGYGGFGGVGAKSGVTLGRGGRGSNPDGSPGPDGGWVVDPTTPGGYGYPVAGSWNSVTKEGSGGGGGQGAQSYSDQPESYGATGSSGSGYDSPGESPVAVPGTNQSSNYGGGGGGINVAPFTGGAAEYYGRGWQSNQGNGVVIVKLS